MALCYPRAPAPAISDTARSEERPMRTRINRTSPQVSAKKKRPSVTSACFSAKLERRSVSRRFWHTRSVWLGSDSTSKLRRYEFDESWGGWRGRRDTRKVVREEDGVDIKLKGARIDGVFRGVYKCFFDRPYAGCIFTDLHQIIDLSFLLFLFICWWTWLLKNQNFLCVITVYTSYIHLSLLHSPPRFSGSQ